MASFFRLASLGPRNTNTNPTRPEKTSRHNGKVDSKKSVHSPDKSIPASRSRLSEYSQSRDLYLDNDGTLFVQANSGVTVNKDPSMSSMIRLSQSKTQDSSIRTGGRTRDEQRIDNSDGIPNRGRKLERRDDSTLRDEKVKHRSTSRRNDGTKVRRRSTTPKASYLRGRSLQKYQKNVRRSKSRNPPTRSSIDNKKNTKDNDDDNNNNSNRQRRTISRPKGKFVSNKKKWNIAVGNGRFLPQISRSASADSRIHKKKKDQKQASRRASFTTKTSKDEIIAGQVTRDDTIDNHVGDMNKDKYHPRSGYAIGKDDHSLIDGLDAVDDTYWDFLMKKREQKCSDVETLDEICSFDDSILDAYKDGWLATYDRCLGSMCGFEVDDDNRPLSGKGKQRSQLNWIKAPSCTGVDQTCALADMTDDVVMEILGQTNEIKQPISLDVNQKK